MSGTSAGLSAMMGSVTQPTPTPVPSPFPAEVPSEPSWLDMANFWVNLGGTITSTIIAIVAVGLTVYTVIAGRRREDRAKREAWARDYMLWLDDGTVYLATGLDAAMLTDRVWITRGSELENRARVFDPESSTIASILNPAEAGASAYMRAQRTAREHIEKMPIGDRISAATTATRMLKLWVEGWVDQPKKKPGDIVEWLNTVSSKDEPSTNPPEPSASE